MAIQAAAAAAAAETIKTAAAAGTAATCDDRSNSSSSRWSTARISSATLACGGKDDEQHKTESHNDCYPLLARNALFVDQDRSSRHKEWTALNIDGVDAIVRDGSRVVHFR